MKKKVFIFISLFFLGFIGTNYYFHVQQLKYQSYLTKVEKLKSEVEKEKLKQISQVHKHEEEKQKINTGNTQKLIEKAVANQLTDIDSLLNMEKQTNSGGRKVRYQRLYLMSMQKNNISAAAKSIKKLLKYTDNKDIWLSRLVDLEIQLGNFKEAQTYAKQLINIAPTKDNLHKYLYVLLQNTNFFDSGSVDKLKNVVSELYKKGALSLEDLSFYNFLVQILSDWDVKTIEKSLPMVIKDLKTPDYKNLLVSIQSDLKMYKQSKGSPLYYFKALVALDLLKYGYFGLAENIAEQVYIQDSNYILPKQILGYSFFYMGNYQQSIKYFQELKNEDQGKTNEYNFFIGLSYFWLGEYEKALIYLAQVSPKTPYYEDALRYMLLSYFKIEDKENIIKTISKLSNYPLNYVDYYNIFRYLFFKCSDCYKDNLKLEIKLMQNCYKDVTKDQQYVCWYGKGNLFLKFGKKKIAVEYFKLLTKYFQDPYLWDTIASYYESKNDIKQARYYYLKELMYTSDPKKRQIIKDKIKKLFLKAKDNK